MTVQMPIVLLEYGVESATADREPLRDLQQFPITIYTVDTPNNVVGAAGAPLLALEAIQTPGSVTYRLFVDSSLQIPPGVRRGVLKLRFPPSIDWNDAVTAFYVVELRVVPAIDLGAMVPQDLKLVLAPRGAAGDELFYVRAGGGGVNPACANLQCHPARNAAEALTCKINRCP